MQYLILSKDQTTYAEQISRKLFQLSRPDSTRSPSDVTAQYSGWSTHPIDGRVALSLPDEELFIHEEADTDTLAELIGAAITAEEKDATKAAILSRRGATARLLDFLPASLTTNLKTEAELKADGWFPDPTV